LTVDSKNQLLEAGGISIFETDRDGYIETINSTLLQTFGYKEKDVLGKSWINELIDESDHIHNGRTRPEHYVVNSGNGKFGSKYVTYQFPFGKKRVKQTVLPRTDINGQLNGYSILVYPETEQEIEMPKINGDHPGYKESFTGIKKQEPHIGMIELNNKGFVTSVSHLLLTYLGYESYELVGKSFDELLQSGDGYFENQISTGRSTENMKLTFISKKGHSMELPTSVKILRDSNNGSNNKIMVLVHLAVNY